MRSRLVEKWCLSPSCRHLKFDRQLHFLLVCICTIIGSDHDNIAPFRISLLMLRFMAIFIVQSYCATITASSLTVKLPFTNLEELSQNEEYKILIPNAEDEKLIFVPKDYFTVRRSFDLDTKK